LRGLTDAGSTANRRIPEDVGSLKVQAIRTNLMPLFRESGNMCNSRRMLVGLPALASR
jgi:hypothetical protein